MKPIAGSIQTGLLSSYRDAGHPPRYHWSTLQDSEECCMADHIDGPLYYERMGRTGPVMAFVHPNPMDRRLWPENQAVSTVGSDARLP